MQNQFYNQPVVNWAKQNLSQPVEIKLRFASRWARALLYLLLYSIPVLILALLIISRWNDKKEGGWLGFILGSLLCGGVMLLPPTVIVLIGVLTRQKFVKSLDAEGVKSSMGRRYLWQNLYYVDHVSKIRRAGNVSLKTKDNQLELVFADGKAIVPPLIYDRDRIWNLINSMPAQVRVDGEVRTASPNPAGNINNFDDFVKALGEMKAPGDQNR